MTPIDQVDRPDRADSHVLVHVRAPVDGEERGFFGWSSNFSEGGMLLTCEPLIEVGERIEVDFFVPLTKQRITVVGETVRCEPSADQKGYDYGIRFQEFTEGSSQMLQDYVAWRLGAHLEGPTDVAPD